MFEQRQSSVRVRALVLFQVLLIIASLFAPMLVLGADPVAPPNPSPSATAPAATPDPTPAPAPTDTPAPVPTDTPAPAPTDTPAPVPTDTPAPAPTPSPAPDIALHFIVAFTASSSAADRAAALTAAGATAGDAIPALNLQSITLPSSTAVAGIDSLRASPSVVRVDADATRDAGAVPSDTNYGSQWSLPKIGWDQAWGTVNPAGSATVAILDTGVEAAQPDLAGQLVAGTSILDGSAGTTDPNGHGTAMAGIV
ncbi:MAG: hypothetical protein HY264_06160, partial [Chloroflexi bacterium]|nr:hypothetical protein [Chloroflexota bacterium]